MPVVSMFPEYMMWVATGATLSGCCMLYATSRNQYIFAAPVRHKGVFRTVGWGELALSFCCLWQIKSATAALFMQILLMMLVWLLFPIAVAVLRQR
ncbi:hypothetical protein APA386B_331 [Acetobacter pasteurianus 386B]|nr:hypothetical protein APA386B_331 [Acetobacter pasteurianus 386B]